MSNTMFNCKYRSCLQFVQRIPAPARSQSLRIALKFLLLFALLSFLLATPASATTYTVKAGGGGDFTTIQACATAMANGDTCAVFVGTYNEHVTVTAGGVASYKTLTVNPGDIVNVLDFTINSHVKINGFHITNPTSPNSSDCLTINANSTDFFITNNTFYACGFHAMIFEPSSGTTTGHGFIQGNTLSYSCSTSAAPNVCGGMQLYGSYHLIENNDISHVSDGFSNFDGDHNVIRNNTMHDTNTSDCGSNSSNCHIDFLETEPSVPPSIPSQFNVIEGNTELNNLGSDGHAWLAQSDACNNQCHNLIIRFNIGAHVGSAGILDDNAGNSTPPGYSYVKSFNNTWIDYNHDPKNQSYGGTNTFTHNSTNGADINDLFYYPESLADFNPYATDSSTVGTFSVGHNLAFCTGSPCNIHGKVYSSGNFTDDPGNIKADPLLVNYGGNDFHLSVGSPAIGAGTSLTTALGSGSSSTSLTVADAGYFQDGFGIAGVQPDWIRIGASTTVQISSIVDATTITLASPASWSAGDPIYLYKNSTGTQVLFGSAPDIGALPFSGSGGCATQRDVNTGTATGSMNPGQYSGGIYTAVPFTASSTYTLCGVTLRMAKVGNPPNMTAYIYSDNSGVPGMPLGTGSASFNSSTLPSSEGDAAFVGLTASLTAGTQYWIVVDVPSGDGTDYTNWYFTNGNASNSFWSSPNGSAPWTNQNTFVFGKFTTFSQ